ncbi:MAG: hypothetical protein NTNFB02_01590 [Nitrospira sp.]
MTDLSIPLNLVEHAIASAAPADCPALLGELERLKGLAHLRMLVGRGPSGPAPLPQTDSQYLTVAQVADRFCVTPKWLYRHKKQMPHSQPSRKVLLFPEQAVTKWFASRKGL